MADEKHLEILRQGVESWNKWRDENPDIRPDLSKAKLSKAKLSAANLYGADLTEANLHGADLTGATLSRADLRGADLEEANLKSAWLSETDLTGALLSDVNFRYANLYYAKLNGARLGQTDLSNAILYEADLSEAILIGATLIRAMLSGADLSGAMIGYITFADVDLCAVKGLDTVEHTGPSTIGIDTIYKSRGILPVSFLRGCGVQDIFIEYLPSLTGQPIQFYSCFISYSSKDTSFAERLHADLQSKGVRCWFAPEDMKIGDKIRYRIDESIRVHDKLLLVLSEYSMASEWVEHEVEHALDLEIERKEPVLFPVRLDRAVMDSKTGWAAKIRRERHIGEFEKWKDHNSYQKAFQRLLRDLKVEEGK